ncbi:MAG: cadmium resistance transporter [Labilithrix sp.]|nr:cadmium resistance transporter [Labilithrix sp.]MCW5813278.1 cadmium resistance transporter [Labilithrix sp.]
MIASSELLATFVKGVVVFASTNVDDVVLLTVLFADPTLRPRAVVGGQVLGIAVLVGASVAVAAFAVAVPARWISLVGIVPLALGLYKGVEVLRARGVDEGGPPKERLAGASQVLAVAAVTIANGGDNLGVYVPLFAVERRHLFVYVPVFAVMTALWCALAFRLVDNQAVRSKVRRYGRVVLPIVLVLLGLQILAGGQGGGRIPLFGRGSTFGPPNVVASARFTIAG